jgi:GNAT superfamily N-acetyltransferase
MRWPSAQTMATLSPLPAQYRYAGLGRADIEPTIALVKEWHPGVAVGVNGCFLRESFYQKRVSLDGELERDVIVFRILHREETIGFWSFEREVDSLAIWGRLLVLAPEYRGKGLAISVLAGSEALGREMGAAFVYAFAPLSTPHVQQGLERAGFRVLGFFPGRDREEVAPGVVKRVYQAVYAKLLVAEDQVHWPDLAKMTPRAREMYGLLFPERMQQVRATTG